MNTKKVSIIIPNYNGEKILKECLDSVLDQTYKNMEIIVVDDASIDQSIEILNRYKEVKLVVNEHNSGFAASVNKGILTSKGEYVLLLNNDVVVENDFVEEMVRAIEAKEKVFSVSAKMIRYNERDLLDDTGDFYHIFGWAFKRGDGKPVNNKNRSTKIFSTCGGAGLYDRAVLNEIGLLDEQFFAYLEDVDLSYRAQIYGYKNWYAPKAICYHIGSATTAEGNKYSPFKVKISARNNIYLIYKNMPVIQLILNSPFLVLGVGIKGALFAKRGFGKAYKDGLKEGIRSLNNVKKQPFAVRNLWHYFLIEGQLILNSAKHVIELIG